MDGWLEELEALYAAAERGNIAEWDARDEALVAAWPRVREHIDTLTGDIESLNNHYEWLSEHCVKVEEQRDAQTRFLGEATDLLRALEHEVTNWRAEGVQRYGVLAVRPDDPVQAARVLLARLETEGEVP